MIRLAWLAVFAAGALGQSVAEPDCRALNDSGRAAEAARCYTSLRASSPDPLVRQRALLGSARNRLWSGDQGGALRDYAEFLGHDPHNRAVAMEYIRVLRYRGAYERAEQWCDRLLAANPHDSEVLALRSEVLFWAGHRAFAARRDADASESAVAQIAAQQALGLNRAAGANMRALEPGDAGSDMGRYLEERLAEQSHWHTDPAYSVYNDSDGIHDSMLGTSLALPIGGDHALRMNVAEFRASAPTGVFTAGRNQATVGEFSVGGTALVSPGLSLAVHAGGSMIMGSSGDLRPTYGVALEGSPWDRWTVSLRSAREFLPVTPRSVDQGVSSDSLAGGLTRWFDSRTSVAVDVDRRWWSDANRSVRAEAVLARRLVYGRAFNLDTGALTEHLAFSRDMLAVSGFFTPDHYSRYAGFADVHGEAGKRLVWELRGDGGAQRLLAVSAFDPSWSATARVSWKFARSLRLAGSYERKNYSLISRGGWYQGFFATLRMQP